MATATAAEYSTIIAVFAGYDQANQAIDELRHAGYGYDHIRLVERGPNNFFESIKSLFASQGTAMATSANDWMRIGVPEQEAHHYQEELDSGRPIVLVKSVDDPERALGMLRQCGSYDLSIRLRTSPPAGGTRQPGVAQTTQGTQDTRMQDTSRQERTYTPSGQPSGQPTTPGNQPGYDATEDQPRSGQPGYDDATDGQPRQTAPSNEQRL